MFLKECARILRNYCKKHAVLGAHLLDGYHVVSRATWDRLGRIGCATRFGRSRINVDSAAG